MRTSLSSMRFAILVLQIATMAWSQTFTEVPGSPFATGLAPAAVAAGYFNDVAFANWLGQLNGGQLSRGDVMGAFVNGPEFDNIVRSRAYANLLYMGFLRRTPDPAGLTYWTGILAAANPLSGAIYGFINGPEYLNRLASLTP